MISISSVCDVCFDETNSVVCNVLWFRSVRFDELINSIWTWGRGQFCAGMFVRPEVYEAEATRERPCPSAMRPRPQGRGRDQVLRNRFLKAEAECYEAEATRERPMPSAMRPRPNATRPRPQGRGRGNKGEAEAKCYEAEATSSRPNATRPNATRPRPQGRGRGQVLWGRGWMLRGRGRGQSRLTINAHVDDRHSKYDWFKQN